MPTFVVNINTSDGWVFTTAREADSDLTALATAWAAVEAGDALGGAWVNGDQLAARIGQKIIARFNRDHVVAIDARASA